MKINLWSRSAVKPTKRRTRPTWHYTSTIPNSNLIRSWYRWTLVGACLPKSSSSIAPRALEATQSRAWGTLIPTIHVSFVLFSLGNGLWQRANDLSKTDQSRKVRRRHLRCDQINLNNWIRHERHGVSAEEKEHADETPDGKHLLSQEKISPQLIFFVPVLAKNSIDYWHWLWVCQQCDPRTKWNGKEVSKVPNTHYDFYFRVPCMLLPYWFIILRM